MYSRRCLMLSQMRLEPTGCECCLPAAAMLQLSTVSSTTVDGCRCALKHQTLLAITPSQPLDRHLGSGTRTDGMPDPTPSKARGFKTTLTSIYLTRWCPFCPQLPIPCRLTTDKPSCVEGSGCCSSLQSMSCDFKLRCAKSGVADLQLVLMIAVGLIC